MKKAESKRMVKRRLRESMENQAKDKELKFIKVRHQKHQKYERQKYLEEEGIKTAREMIKTKLEM